MIAKKFVFPLSRVPVRLESGRWGERFKLHLGESLPESDASKEMEETLDAFRAEGFAGYVVIIGELFEP